MLTVSLLNNSLRLLYKPFWTFWLAVDRLKKNFIVHAVSKHFVQHGRARRTYVQELQPGESSSPRDRQGEAEIGAPAPGHGAASATPAASHFGRRWVIRVVSRLLWGQQLRIETVYRVIMTLSGNQSATSPSYGCISSGDGRRGEPERRPTAGPPEVGVCGLDGPRASRGQERIPALVGRLFTVNCH